MPSDNVPEKCLTVRLFFNKSNLSHYIQVGGTLCMVKASTITTIQNREGLDIIQVDDVKSMQIEALKKLNDAN